VLVYARVRVKLVEGFKIGVERWAYREFHAADSMMPRTADRVRQSCPGGAFVEFRRRSRAVPPDAAPAA